MCLRHSVNEVMFRKTLSPSKDLLSVISTISRHLKTTHQGSESFYASDSIATQVEYTDSVFNQSFTYIQ